MKNIGIGFVTGRKQFQNVLKSYISNWLEHGLLKDNEIRLHLFIAYDLKYQKTRISDYKDIPLELAAHVESINFIGTGYVTAETARLKKKGILTDDETNYLFGEGYAKKRNTVMYAALSKKMDCLMFLDDDEYPMAVSQNEAGKLVWMGQSVVGTHLANISAADITHGHHCGYISPIPFMEFDDDLKEPDFKLFIEAISNDIISWDKIRNTVIGNQGITFADNDLVNYGRPFEVQEKNGMKFISGGNLCINFKNATSLPPFYNPPGARGEDTFLSTGLSDMRVLKVPCYTFHDGFGMYKHILNGVLPTTLTATSMDSVATRRFINASIGWIRYKPLLIYITQSSEYTKVMNEIEDKLRKVVPKLGRFFKTKEFDQVLKEFRHFAKNAPRHFQEFSATKEAWSKLMNSI